MEVSALRNPGGLEQTKINALVLDDSDFDRQRIRRMGEKSDLHLNILEACSIADLDTRLNQSIFDVILIDYSLTDGDGLNALDMVRQSQNNQKAATIMISGTAKTDVAVSALKRGCNDFLNKHELSPANLQEAIHGALSHNLPAVQSAPKLPDTLRLEPGKLVEMFDQALNDPAIQNSLEKILARAMTRVLPAGTALSVDTTEDEAMLVAGLLQADSFKFRG